MAINKKLFSKFDFFGSLYFYLFILFISLINISYFLFLFFSLFISYLITVAFRLSIEKERPLKQKYKTFFQLIKARSFPSMHSTKITLLGFFACYTYPSTLIYLLSSMAVFLVSYSRILNQEHDIYDVLGGVFLGLAVSFIILMTLPKIF